MKLVAQEKSFLLAPSLTVNGLAFFTGSPVELRMTVAGLYLDEF